MTRWRKRLGDAGAEQMLRGTIEAGMKMGVIRPAELKRVNVDTTVETKAIRFPTDARLYQRMRERLVKAARAEGLTIKQSYRHVGRRLLMQSSRYAHAPQMKRARACTRKAEGDEAAGLFPLIATQNLLDRARQVLCALFHYVE